MNQLVCTSDIEGGAIRTPAGGASHHCRGEHLAQFKQSSLEMFGEEVSVFEFFFLQALATVGPGVAAAGSEGLWELTRSQTQSLSLHPVMDCPAPPTRELNSAPWHERSPDHSLAPSDASSPGLRPAESGPQCSGRSR